MIVGSIKEDISLEKRVSLTPDSAKNIIGLGLKVCIEKGYALHLGINDSEYKDIGVEIKVSSKEVLNSSDLITKLKNKKWDNGNDIFDPTSFQISNISSGTGAHNVVPGNLEIIFNFRFSTESSEQSLKADFESIINDLGINYECEWDLNGDPYLTEENFFKDIVCSSVEEITGYLPELNAKGGTSDGRFISKTGCEIVELGPKFETIHKIDEKIEKVELERLTDIHQVDEHVKISDLWKLKDIYKNILVNLNQNL